MRQALHDIGRREHITLAYDAWAPVENDGKVPDVERTKWLSELANVSMSPDYAQSFDRWKASFANAGDRLAELKLTSRLLVGHGNSSATDVGLTVHHTWGVPVIPGSTLKGLLAHYVDATYGPTDPDKNTWEQEGDERIRADYQGITWNGQRIQRGPGAVYRALFGAPDAKDDQTMREHHCDAGASAGLVTFHDALYVPGSAGNRPFAPDVLTVHQKSYYDSLGKKAPNDYDNPVPVSFLTVRPTCSLLLALSGPSEWTELAGRLLKDALENWGVGGKTSAGYGMGTVTAWKQPKLQASKLLEDFEAWLSREANAAAPQRQQLAEFVQRWLSQLSSLSDDERQRANNELKKVIKSPKLIQERDSILAQLMKGRSS